MKTMEENYPFQTTVAVLVKMPELYGTTWNSMYTVDDDQSCHRSLVHPVVPQEGIWHLWALQELLLVRCPLLIRSQ